MSLQRHLWAGKERTLWIRAVLASAALFSLLAAQNVPSHFPQATCVHSSVGAPLHHDQRPRFDNNGPKWSAPAATFVPAPPAVESAGSTLIPQLSFAVQAKGVHFNRPPPIS